MHLEEYEFVPVVYRTPEMINRSLLRQYVRPSGVRYSQA